MTRDEFLSLADRLAAAWNAGDAEGAAACFAVDVAYSDPMRYSFTSRDALLPFFEPPPGGHRVAWHRILFDEAAQTGVLEYTYEGHHRYHGVALAEVGRDGTIRRWREWQHVSDDADWGAYLSGRS